MLEKPIIQTHHLSVKYGNIDALEDVSISIVEKSFTAIIGPNGGGKSTLLKSLLGLVKFEKEQVSFNQKVTWGYVPQTSNFDRRFPIDVKNVIQTGALNEGFKFFHKYRKEDDLHMQEVMKTLDIENLSDRQIGELSGGQLQRVLIARALMAKPNVLLLDEPTAGLDKESKNRLFKKLYEMNKDMTIVVVTHDIEDILDYADKVIHVHRTAHEHSNLLKTGGNPTWSMRY